MGKSDANECNESLLSNCRVQLALSTKKDGMILEKQIYAVGFPNLMQVCILLYDTRDRQKNVISSIQILVLPL